MKYFEPVFIADEFKIIVLVLVPNACYLKRETFDGVPDDVATPNDGNYHHTVVLSNARIGQSILPGDVSFSAVCSLIPDFVHVFELDYGAADDEGKDLTVYVATINSETGDTEEKKRKRVERKVKRPI
jgi:hypothetical protein